MISKPDFAKKQIIFVFTSEGDKLSFSNDNVIVRDKDNKIKHQSTCYRLFALFIVGNVTITSGLIQRAKKFGFVIFLMNRNMKLYQVIGKPMEGNTLLHQKQYAYKQLERGKHILINKLNNQKKALQELRSIEGSTKQAITKINDYSQRLKSEELNLQEMLGLEGLAARLYFKEMFNNIDWNGRQPRIKRDYVNSALDIGYTMLFNVVDALLNIYDFDTYYGVLHTCFYMRKSLVCDLIEPMRPIIDKQIRKAINYGQIKPEHFKTFGARYVLEYKYSPKYVSVLAEPIIKNRIDMFTYVQSFYRSVMKDRPADEFPKFVWG